MMSEEIIVLPTTARGRTRSSYSKAAIIQATMDLLKNRPLRDLTIEAIAEKAGVGKTTIYRWWPSKAYLALEAYKDVLSKQIPLPGRGRLKHELTRLLVSSLAFARTREGKLVGQFLSETQHDPDFARHFQETITKPRREAISAMLFSAASRGELRPNLNYDFIIEMIYGPLILRIMSGQSLPPMDIDQTIDVILHGISSSRGTKT